MTIVCAILMVAYCIMDSFKRNFLKELKSGKMAMHTGLCFIKTIDIIALLVLMLVNRFILHDDLLFTGKPMLAVALYLVLTLIACGSIYDVIHALQLAADELEEKQEEGSENEEE